MREIINKRKVKGVNMLRMIFKYRSILPELLDLVEVSVASMQDGKISSKERSALMKKFWALVKALEKTAKK